MGCISLNPGSVRQTGANFAPALIVNTLLQLLLYAAYFRQETLMKMHYFATHLFEAGKYLFIFVG